MPNPGDPATTITIDLTHHPPQTPLGIMLAPASASSTLVSSPITSPTSNNTVILAGWNRTENKKLGPVQKLGLVRIGDRLVEINGVDIREMEFRHVLDLLKNMILRKDGSSGSGVGNGIIPLKSLGFAPFFIPPKKKNKGMDISSGSGGFLSSLIWTGPGGTTANERKKEASLGGETAWNIAKNRQLYIFSSTIGRIRICQGTTLDISPDEDSGRHEPGQQQQQKANDTPFVQYEIACQLTVQCTNITSLGEKREAADQQISWSVWKRYSEFQALDAKLCKIGRHVAGRNVSFPPSHHLRSILMNVFSGDGGCMNRRQWQKQEQQIEGTTRIDSEGTSMQQKFVQKRREELVNYWEALSSSENMFDFADPSLHRYSRDMSIFLEVERHFPRTVNGRRTTATGVSDCDGDSSNVIGDASSLSLSQGMRSRNFKDNIATDMDESTMSQQSSQLSSLYDQSRGTLPLHGNHNGEIILTKKCIHTSSSLPNRLDSRVRKQKRVAAAAKPAFQRRLLDSL